MGGSEPDPGARVRIRRATPEDRFGMARVHVESWKTTYRGMVPDDRLDSLTVESDIAGGFGSLLQEPRPGFAQFVATTNPGEVVGFAAACPNREPDGEYTGELGAIYILRPYQRLGVGTSLVRAVARFLGNEGHTSMIVWVLEQNPYRRFYEKLGGTPVRKRMGPSRIAGRSIPEVSYGWRDLSPLMR
jgi:GNAT superfamily N-acetyltransferase